MTPGRRVARRRAARRVAVALMIALLFAALALTRWGAPAPLIRGVERTLARRGATMTLATLRWRWPLGVVAEKVAWTSRAGGGSIHLRAGTLAAAWTLQTLLSGRWEPAVVEWRDTEVEWRSAGADPLGRLTALAGRAIAESGAWWRIVGRGTWAGADLDVDLHVRRTGPWARAAAPRPPPGPPVVAPPRWPQPWQRVEFRGGCLRLAGRIDLDDPGGADVQLVGSGGAATWAGLPWERWDISARWSERTLSVLRLALDGVGSRLSIAGAWRPGHPPEVSLAARLSPLLAMAFPLPPAADRYRASAALRVEGPLRLEGTVLPDPAHPGGVRGKGWVAASRFELGGVWVEQARAELVASSRQIEVKRLLAIVGEGSGAGPLVAQGTVDLAACVVTGGLAAAFDPMALAAWMTPAQLLNASAARWFGPPPSIRMVFRVPWDDPGSLEIEGTGEASNFAWNGALLRRASARFAVRDSVVRLEDVYAEAPHGWIAGRAEHDPTRRSVFVDAVATVPPPVVARLAGPRPHLFMSQFGFGDSCRLAVRGTVDYGERTNYQGELAFEGGTVSFAWFTADRLSVAAAVEGRRVDIRSFGGQAFGGSFGGRAGLILPAGPAERTQYAVTMSVTNAALAEVLRAVTDRNDLPQIGRLYGELSLTGRVGRGQGAGVVGVGTVRVRRGHLLEIPLFGGLSRHLSSVVPGLGFVSQGDFRASFRVADGWIWTDLAELRGDVLSLEGRGAYALDRRLDFVVGAKLLRSGAAADVLRLLTLPVTRLLEFELRGTLENPVWTPRNLPGARR